MADSSQPSSAAAAPFPHIRSCELCRQRKVKCDRRQPCSHCTRSGQDCVYPAGPGRAPKRSRRAENAQLMDKLSRLEHIIKRLASENKGDSEAAVEHHSEEGVDQTQSTPHSSRPDGADRQQPSKSASGEPEVSGENNASLDVQFGRLVINDSKSYYVGNVLWANLANEVHGLRDMVKEAEEHSDDDETDVQPVPPDQDCGPSGSNAALFGFRALAYSLLSFHPSLPQAVNLFAVFTENVSPVIRLFHMPTLSKSYWEAIASLDSLDKNTEALLFAIYYSTTISISNPECLSLLGVSRDAATEKYRFAVEQALARAELLNTHSMVLLQAAVLFLSALRNQDDSRTTWSLTALVFYVAQSMGLHRDGTVFGLMPFETELRRRLWWYICVLDGHSSKYQEHEANLHQFFSDTKLPLNINDSDLHPDMTDAPPERDGWTDMTFCLVRCEAINTASSTKLIGPGLQRGPWRAGGDSRSTGLGVEGRRAIVQDFVETVTDKYLRHCDPSVPVLLMSSMVIKLIFARFWLLVYRPQPGPNSNETSRETSATPADQRGSRGTTPSDHENKTPVDRQTRDRLFITSVEVLELSTTILTHPKLVRWAWYSRTYVQWHAIGFVLAEICCRPPSAECDRAWTAVMGVYDSGILRTNEPKGAVWKPIRRLMARARYIRGMQGRQGASADSSVVRGPVSEGWDRSQDSRGVVGRGLVHGDSASPATFSTAPLGSAVQSTTTGLGPGMPSLPSSGSGDYLMELLDFPGNMGTDDFTDFGMAAGNNGFSLDMMGAGSAMDGWDGRMW
ncbi:hypothetical protein LA080_009296 [Diaporthe eres]|uniref:Zn(2)-C6 fungal-type domain-containing protein n=1 Tax=Diaporthe vaccinii TaxID=105482 RepID=A0ABR4E564_9PEZI|nr:hypothetical protein LA080_009296 [Diaporthe eres]